MICCGVYSIICKSKMHGNNSTKVERGVNVNSYQAFLFIVNFPPLWMKICENLFYSLFIVLPVSRTVTCITETQIHIVEQKLTRYRETSALIHWYQCIKNCTTFLETVVCYIKVSELCLSFGPTFLLLRIYHKEVIKNVYRDISGRLSHNGMKALELTYW